MRTRFIYIYFFLNYVQQFSFFFFLIILSNLFFFFFTGVSQVSPESINDKDAVAKLFYHESQRVFHDRLINEEDKQYFHTILAEMANKYFSQVLKANV